MYTFLLSGLVALLAIDDRQTGQPAQGQPGQSQPGQSRPGGGDRSGMAASIDGNWTVVAAEMNGQPVAEAKNLTVNVKDNIVTFTGGGGATGADKGKMKALRLSFGPNATIRVTEAGADGKFGGTGTQPGGTGTGTTPAAGGAGQDKGAGGQPGGTGAQPGAGTQPGGTGTTQPGGTTGGQPGAATAAHGTKSGVYVLTQDYLAICIHDDAAAGGAGTRPGGAGTGGQPGGTGTTPPAGGTGTQPGGTGTAQPGGTGTAQPGGTGTQPGGTGTQPGGTGSTQPGGTAGGQSGTAGSDMMRPNTRTYMTVILKRADGGARPGDTPKRDKE